MEFPGIEPRPIALETITGWPDLLLGSIKYKQENTEMSWPIIPCIWGQICLLGTVSTHRFCCCDLNFFRILRSAEFKASIWTVKRLQTYAINRKDTYLKGKRDDKRKFRPHWRNEWRHGTLCSGKLQGIKIFDIVWTVYHFTIYANIRIHHKHLHSLKKKRFYVIILI